VILQRGKTLPIVRMRDTFHLDRAITPAERALDRQSERRSKQEPTSTPDALPQASGARNADMLYLVVVGMAEKQVGLAVDSLIGSRKSLSRHWVSYWGYPGDLRSDDSGRW